MTRKSFSSLLLVIYFAVGLSTAQAEEKKVDNKIHYEFTPYLWFTSQNGDVEDKRLPGSGISVDQNFSQILDRMDKAGMASFEVRKKRWGLLVDGIYLQVSDGISVSGPNGLIGLNVDGNITQQQYSAAGFYRVREGMTTVDAIAGLRYNKLRWNVSAELTSPDIPELPEISRTFRNNKNWLDPYIGFRVLHRVNKKLTLVGYADVGVTDTGSNTTWQVIGGINYEFRPNITAKLGYRAVGINYEKDWFKYDMKTSGIYLGVGFAW